MLERRAESIRPLEVRDWKGAGETWCFVTVILVIMPTTKERSQGERGCSQGDHQEVTKGNRACGIDRLIRGLRRRACKLREVEANQGRKGDKQKEGEKSGLSRKRGGNVEMDRS